MNIIVWSLPFVSNDSTAIYAAHLFSWYFIYAGVVMSDLGDFLGLKQGCNYQKLMKQNLLTYG
jgi:hypothetical protein